MAVLRSVCDFGFKPFRSVPSSYWLAVSFVSVLWISACSPDGAENRSGDRSVDQSVDVPATTAGTTPGQDAALSEQAPSLPLGPEIFQSAAPEAAPTRWMGLIGEYGSDDDVWLLREDEARLELRHGA